MPIVVELSEVAQQLLFDPTDEDTGTELDVMAGPYGLVSLDAPAPQPEFVWAGNMDTEGEAKAAQKHQNRRVTIVVDVTASNATSRDAALDALAEKAAKVYRDGGTLRLVKQTGDYRTLDLLAAESYEPQFDIKWSLGQAATVTMGFVAKPYAREPEVEVGDWSEVALPALVFTTGAIDGDVPALGRLEVTDGSANEQNTVRWAIQADHYSSDAAAGLFYELTNTTYFTAAGGAASTAHAPASGGTALLQGGLTTSYADQVTWSALKHVGTFAVYARLNSPAANSGTVTVRLAYGQTGDLSLMSLDPVTITNHADYRIVKLGIVHLPYVARGSQTWQGEIQATSTSNGDDLYLDSLMFFPVEEGFGQAGGSNVISALEASKMAELAHDGYVVQKTATVWGPAASYEGDYLLIPPAEAVRFIVKASRGPLTTGGSETDPGIDDISATLYATPRFLSLA